MRTPASLIAIAVVASLFIVGCSSSKVQPDGSRIGTMTAGQLPEVVIDGNPMRLAPGARVYNQNNLTITPAQVPAGSRVRYKTDETGQVSQVWVMPPER